MATTKIIKGSLSKIGYVYTSSIGVYVRVEIIHFSNVSTMLIAQESVVDFGSTAFAPAKYTRSPANANKLLLQGNSPNHISCSTEDGRILALERFYYLSSEESIIIKPATGKTANYMFIVVEEPLR